ncbi:EAL domain-containing protein [Aquihabitans daechungensis]|uniref:EAL domain-containing protein n=1 Tax=Aquihabitans daechungensis TaxID=1052257 RepID=UPI003B9DFF06
MTAECSGEWQSGHAWWSSSEATGGFGRMAKGRQLITALGDAVHPMSVMQRVTDRTLELMAPAFGVMVGLADDDGITYVAGSGNQEDLVGTRVQMGQSLSGLSIRSGEVLRSDDTEEDARVDLEACRRHFVRSLVCVPLQRDGRAVGVLAVNAPEPGVFSDEDVLTLTQLASFVTVAISSAFELHRVSAELVALGVDQRGGDVDDLEPTSAAQRYVMSVLTPGGASALDARARIEPVLLDPTLLSIAVQPVIDLASGEVFAVEALSRFGVEPIQPPDQWFARAHECDLGIALEVLAVRRAIAELPHLPDHVAMTINVGPLTVRSPLFAEALDQAPHDRLILELTEHTVVDDYPELIASLRSLRRSGLRVAVDDTGSGYSSLAHILKIAPDFIKVDRELTSGIDLDPVRRALVLALVMFAADTGAQIVAEGIETVEELAELRRLSVSYGQGYHLGRPSPAADLLATPRTLPPT